MIIYFFYLVNKSNAKVINSKTLNNKIDDIALMSNKNKIHLNIHLNLLSHFKEILL